MVGGLFLASNYKVFFKSCLNIPLESGLGGHVVSFNFYDLWPPVTILDLPNNIRICSVIANTHSLPPPISRQLSISVYILRTIWTTSHSVGTRREQLATRQNMEMQMVRAVAVVTRLGDIVHYHIVNNELLSFKFQYQMK